MMNKLMLILIILLQTAPLMAHATDTCDDNVMIAATQDAQGIANDEDLQEYCTADYDDLKPTSANTYGLKVTCGDDLGFIYDVTVIRDPNKDVDECEIDDISQIALE